MAWQQLSVITVQALCEPIADLLTRLGALSVSFDDAGNQPLYEPRPGETPIWQKTRVTALFAADAALSAVEETILQQLSGDQLSGWCVESLPDQVWERAWLEHFKPMRFGPRLWVCPSGQAPLAAEAVNLTLDPGLAFGTGTHATTALCLEWLDTQDLRNACLIDFGCGSGILAIAAVLLGARSAYAVDIDPQALIATCENACKNRVENAVQCCRPEELADFAADVLIANILAKPLIELAPAIAARVRPGGRLVLSGILHPELDDVQRAYSAHFDFSSAAIREQWVRLIGVRR